jgi:hypothetical protein
MRRGHERYDVIPCPFADKLYLTVSIAQPDVAAQSSTRVFAQRISCVSDYYPHFSQHKHHMFTDLQ